MKAEKLIFVSRIRRDGSGTDPLTKEDTERLYKWNEDFNICGLSITLGTYIASSTNCYVVKLKKNL